MNFKYLRMKYKYKNKNLKSEKIWFFAHIDWINFLHNSNVLGTGGFIQYKPYFAKIKKWMSEWISCLI